MGTKLLSHPLLPLLRGARGDLRVEKHALGILFFEVDLLNAI